MGKTKEAVQDKTGSTNPHNDRNREITQLLRADREEHTKAWLIAENRKLKAEIEQLKAAQSAENGSGENT